MSFAFVFPGQGAQTIGMGKDLAEAYPEARAVFEEVDDALGEPLSDLIWEGDLDTLTLTQNAQPALMATSIAAVRALEAEGIGMERASFVAGHSLGELSALVANGTLSFEDGLKLVAKRAYAMQKACELEAGTMAAILGLEDHVVEEICEITEGDVVAANYNCPGQLVISGTIAAVKSACELATEKGARRALLLPVGGAFHSTLMAPAREELAAAIEATQFNKPSCPVYQNVVAKAVTDPEQIKKNLIAQLTGAVRWTQCAQAMIADGAEEVVEVGPGKVLQGLFAKIDRSVARSSAAFH